MVYSGLGDNKLLHVVFMSLLGVTISGPYNLIVGTIAVDLGSQPALAGNPKAMSTVTGLVDACGSLGSAIGQVFVPIIQDNLGWPSVFYLFVVMVCGCLCALLLTIPAVKARLYRSHFPAEKPAPNSFEMH